METKSMEFTKVIDEVKHITAENVAKKQDVAKLNLPALLVSIKAAAGRGDSFCVFSLEKINEYDKKLLEQEGFVVHLENEDLRNNYSAIARQINPLNPDNKQWRVKW